MHNKLVSNTCDENVFSVFFKKHATSLRNFLIYKFANEKHAEDITQDAFIKLWQNCKDVPLEKAKSYIYTIANNASLNIITHQKVALKYSKSNLNLEINNESPEFIFEENEFKTKLLTAIENLSEIHRTKFLMHRIDKKKYSEIAEELNISVKTVEKRIHVALTELRKNIEGFK